MLRDSSGECRWVISEQQQTRTCDRSISRSLLYLLYRNPVAKETESARGESSVLGTTYSISDSLIALARNGEFGYSNSDGLIFNIHSCSLHLPMDVED